MVQIQTNDGNGVEKTWPPEDMQTLDDLGTWSKTGTVVNGFGSSVTFTSNAFEDLMHLSGLPTLHLSVSTQACQGGQICYSI